ncbi:MAG TPA: hypothetical protein VJ161_00255 [Geobacteraceae bacterium]|nr:hypothetical protein [Geobacteraceae bacterium]
MKNEKRLGIADLYEKKPAFADLSATNEATELSLVPEADQISRLCTLLQNGCFVKVRVGCSLRDLLCGQFNISPDYLRDDIKVLFINFSPVDNVDTAIVRDGIILALSAAMPGLVGAAMRKDGLSWMRSSITYTEQEEERVESEGVIQLKLFNLVMADLGESFLRRGIYVKTDVLADFLERFPDEFLRKFSRITKKGEVISADDLSHFLTTSEGWVKLSIQ